MILAGNLPTHSYCLNSSVPSEGIIRQSVAKFCFFSSKRPDDLVNIDGSVDRRRFRNKWLRGLRTLRVWSGDRKTKQEHGQENHHAHSKCLKFHLETSLSSN